MKEIIKIEIECTETTCASKPGKFCRFLGSIRFGSESVCMLFPSTETSYTVLEDKKGWTQRCGACIKAVSLDHLPKSVRIEREVK